jgi:hypothetical protein
MARRYRTIRQICASVAVIAVLLTGPAFRLASANPVAPSQDTDSINVEGYSVTEKDTGDVNSFLSAHPKRAQFLGNLNARGVNPADVKYVSVASSPEQGGADDLSVLAGRLNEYQTNTGGSPVTSVDMWIGGYRAADGKLDGEVLLVANLENGSQSLVSAVQADDATLAGAGTPNVMNGDFFGNPPRTSPSPVAEPAQGAPEQNAVAIAAFLICWIQCIVIQQIIVILRCIVIAIVVCVGIGPFLVCFGVKITICRLIILIRTIVICYINCVVVVFVAVFKAEPKKASVDENVLTSPGRLPRYGPDKGASRDGLGRAGGTSRVPLRPASARFGLGLAT